MGSLHELILMIWPSLVSVEKNYFSFLASESFQMHFANLSGCKSYGRTVSSCLLYVFLA